MNLVPSKVGADPKKIGFLAGLVVVAVVVYFYNSELERKHGFGADRQPRAGCNRSERRSARGRSIHIPRRAADGRRRQGI